MSPVAGPTLGIFVGFGFEPNTGAWHLGTSTLGTGTVLGPEYITTYSDVAADCRRLHTARGKSRANGDYQPGKLTVVLNNRARDYDPLNLSGPYVTGGVTDVKPGRLIYVTATDPTTGLVHRLFTGRIRSWVLDYVGSFDGVAVIEATDLMTELAGIDIEFASTADDMGAVAAQILVEAGVTQFQYDEGVFQAQAMSWNTKALSALRTLEVSEQGALFVEGNGDVVFASGHQLVRDARSRVSQATFGAGNLGHEHNDIDYDSDLILNDIQLTRQGGVEQLAQDADSIAAYGQRTYSKTGLANASDADVGAIADFLTSKWGEPLVRIRGIDFHPRKHADLMTQALTRRLRDRITVGFTPPGSGTISQELFITGIEHEIRPGVDMQTKFQLESSEWSHGWLLGQGALGTTTQLGL